MTARTREKTDIEKKSEEIAATVGELLDNTMLSLSGEKPLKMEHASLAMLVQFKDVFRKLIRYHATWRGKGKYRRITWRLVKKGELLPRDAVRLVKRALFPREWLEKICTLFMDETLKAMELDPRATTSAERNKVLNAYMKERINAVFPGSHNDRAFVTQACSVLTNTVAAGMMDGMTGLRLYMKFELHDDAGRGAGDDAAGPGGGPVVKRLRFYRDDPANYRRETG